MPANDVAFDPVFAIVIGCITEFNVLAAFYNYTYKCIIMKLAMSLLRLQTYMYNMMIISFWFLYDIKN